MVNTLERQDDRVVPVAALVRVYVVIALATIAVLAILSATASNLATSDAWVHGAIVAGFAALLPMRLRSAVRGSAGAWRAVGIIAGVLCAVNVVEALIPGLFPAWMRVEMVGVAVLMAAVVVLVLRRRP